MNDHSPVVLLLLLPALLLALAGCGGDITVATPIGGGGGPITLFKSASLTQGNFAAGFSARAAADAFVAAGAPAACAGLTVHALLSVSAVDTIANMPANLGVPADQPISGELGPLVADDWADLTDGTIQAPMTWATGVSTNYSTGSNDNGTATGDNCSGWTSKAGNGTVGDQNVTGTGWLNFAAGSCAGNNRLLGICY